MNIVPDNYEVNQFKPGLDIKAHQAYVESERGQRRYSFAAVYTLPNPATLPKSFIHTPLEIKNQYSTDMCLAHALCSTSELQEEVLLDPCYTFMLIKEIMGDWQGFGGSPDAALTAALRGFLPKSDAPYSLDTQTRDFVANPMNWDAHKRAAYDELAAKHAKRAGFWIEKTKQIDLFDAIRGAIYLFREEKRSVTIGVSYSPEWADKTLITDPGSDGGGHAENVLGWDEFDDIPYLAVQNSYGKGVGKEGIQYFSRWVVNDLFFFALMFADRPDDLTHEQIMQISKYYRLNFR